MPTCRPATESGFTFQPESLTGSSGVETFKPVWIADDGVTWGLESFDRTLQAADGKYFVVGSGLPYVPAIADEGEEIFDVGFARLVSDTDYRIVGETSSGADYRLDRITAADNSTSLRYTDSGLVAPTGHG